MARRGPIPIQFSLHGMRRRQDQTAAIRPSFCPSTHSYPAFWLAAWLAYVTQRTWIELGIKDDRQPTIQPTILPPTIVHACSVPCLCLRDSANIWGIILGVGWWVVCLLCVMHYTSDWSSGWSPKA